MNRLYFVSVWVALVIILSCCSSTSEQGLKVVASPVPHAQMLELIKPDLKKQGINLIIIVSDDYNMPNRALANKEVDANFFQHLPFLEEQVKQFQYPIISLAKVEIEPLGIYSKKVNSLTDLRQYALIAIPNDPTNEGRALLLLQKENLIELKNTNLLQATVHNIVKNPKHLKFLEIDAAMLPRALDDVEAAAINTNYALEANLSPTGSALALEDKESPYVNIIAVREGDENRSDIKALKKAMTSEKMRQFILQEYKGAILPAF